MSTNSIWVIFESNHEKNRVCQELMKKAKELAKLQNTKAIAIIINKEQNMYNITFNMIKGNKEVIGKANINPNLEKISAIKLEYKDKIQ